MGKIQSKTANKDIEGYTRVRKIKESGLLKPIKWLAKRCNIISKSTGIEEHQAKAKTRSHKVDCLDNEDSSKVCSENDSPGTRCSNRKEGTSNREKLEMVGLEDENINIINSLDLKISFFLETDQNPGCSYWSEEILHARYNGIRKRSPKIKNEKFGMRSRCSKIHPDITYELSEDNSEPIDSYPSIVESYAGSEELHPTGIVRHCENPREYNQKQKMGTETQRAIEFGSPMISSMNEILKFKERIIQRDDAIESCDNGEETENTIDGLYAHLCYFSPKHIMEGSLSLAVSNDHLQPPIIEIITEEKAQYIVASILVNYTLAKEYAIRGLTEMHTIRMCNSLMMQLNWWQSIFPIQWYQFFMKAIRKSYHRFLSGQVILERKVMGDTECSFEYAKKEGLC